MVPGKKIMLLARRDGAQIRFSLRAGTGSPVARAPWKEEWGGGASVENPHFQRVHYCELLASLHGLAVSLHVGAGSASRLTLAYNAACQVVLAWGMLCYSRAMLCTAYHAMQML